MIPSRPAAPGLPMRSGKVRPSPSLVPYPTGNLAQYGLESRDGPHDDDGIHLYMWSASDGDNEMRTSVDPSKEANG